MPVDLLFYGLVAAGLIFWLRSVLGTRSGGERDRSNNPYLKTIEGNASPPQQDGSSDSKQFSAETLIEELARTPKGNMSIANRTAENMLVDVARVDRSFDVYKFLQAAQDAFVYIVESFADGDRETLKELLDPAVYNAFDGAIAAREKSGETMKTEIHAITKSEIVGGRLEGKKAFVTIRFLAEETSITKDESQNIIHGHPGKITQMRDVWTFCRDLKSRDPRWLVVETREDGDGDNAMIPNTH